MTSSFDGDFDWTFKYGCHEPFIRFKLAINPKSRSKIYRHILRPAMNLGEILSSCTNYSLGFSASTSSSPLYSFVLLLTGKTDVYRRLLTDLFTNSIGLTDWGWLRGYGPQSDQVASSQALKATHIGMQGHVLTA